MSIDWSGGEEEKSGEMVIPPLGGPDAAGPPATAERKKRGRPAVSKGKAAKDDPGVTVPSLAPTIPEENRSTENPSPDQGLEIPSLPGADIPPPAPAVNKERGARFAPPPSKEAVEDLYGIPKAGEGSFQPTLSVDLHPTPGESQADAQSEAGERMAALWKASEAGLAERLSPGGVDDELIKISKETKVEVYKYPERLLLEVPLDPSIIKPRFSDAAEKVGQMCRMVDQANILAEEDAKKLTGLLSDMKRLSEMIDDARLKLTKPYRESAAKINDFASPFIEELGTYIKRGKSKLLTWTGLKRAQDQRRLREQKKIIGQVQEKLREQAEEETRSNREEAVRQGLDPSIVPPTPTPMLPMPVLEKESGKVRAEGGTAYETSEMVCDVLVAGDVPREFCVPSQKLLDQAVESGIRAISGCHIYPKKDIALRVR